MANYSHAFGFVILALVSWSTFMPKTVSAAGECGGPYPPKPAHVWAKPGPGGGQVTLYWDKTNYANRYAVAYGTSSNNYLYGATNIGGSSTTSYTVSGLNGGTNYYFRIAAARDCTSSPFSDEVSAWSGAGAAVAWSAPNTGTTSTNANLSAWSGPGLGQVTIKWWPWGDVDNYHLVYGTTKDHNQYGALNIGRSGQMTVKSLVPGKNYYFAIVSVKGNQARNTSETVWATAKVPVVVVETTGVSNEQSMEEPVEDNTVLNNGDDNMPVNPDEMYEAEPVNDSSYEMENSNVQGLMDQTEPQEMYYAEENQTQVEESYEDSSYENYPEPQVEEYAEENYQDPNIGAPADF